MSGTHKVQVGELGGETTEWTADPGWMKGTNETPEQRGRTLDGIQKEISPGGLQCLDDEQISDANQRLAAACRVGDRQVGTCLATSALI
jgi:hypothetical protein